MTEGLAVRQVLALRRRGLSHLEALRLTVAGLPDGALRQRLQGAVAALEAGRADPDGPDIFARPDPSDDALRFAALADDAARDAAQVVRTARGYLVLAVGAALAVFATTVLVPMPLQSELRPWETPSTLSGLAVGLAALGGVGVAGGLALVLARLPTRFTPGARHFAVAAGLGAADPVGPAAGFFAVRRAQVGEGVARRELAEELVRLGRREWSAALRLGPPAIALVVAAGVLVLGLVGRVLPLAEVVR